MLINEKTFLFFSDCFLFNDYKKGNRLELTDGEHSAQLAIEDGKREQRGRVYPENYARILKRLIL